MTKAQVIALRTLFNTSGTSYMVVFLEEHAMVSYADKIVWDDTAEMVYATRASNDPYTQAESPIEIIAGSYDNIQYMEGRFAMANFDSVVDTLFGDLATADEVTAIKEFAASITNQAALPIRPSPYYPTDTRIIPGKPGFRRRDDGITEPVIVDFTSATEKYTATFVSDTIGIDDGAVTNYKGYRIFANPKTEAGYTSITYADEAMSNILVFPVTLMADINYYTKWIGLDQTIVFNANTGTGTIANVVEPTGSTVVLTANVFTKAGYAFNGWAITAGGEAAYTDEESITMPAGGLILYATWTAQPQTITFDDNGGTGTAIEDIISVTDSTVTLTTNTYTRDGYEFAGWAVAADGAVVYADGVDLTMPAEGLNLFAAWTALPQTIVFDANTGTGTMSNIVDGTGEEIILTTSTFTKTDYGFIGWSTTAEGEVVYTNGATITMPVGGLTLYAKWSILESITFSPYGDGSGGPSMTTIKAVSGASVTLAECIITRPGYDFIGWSTVPGEAVVYEDEATITMPVGGLTLYTAWELGNSTITFNANDGEGSVDSITALTGSSISLTSNTFIRAGYEFTGWAIGIYDDATYEDGATINMPAGGLTLYAAWGALSQTITFDANGGTGTMDNLTAITGSMVDFSANTFTKDEYTFVGWSATNDNSTVLYTDEATITMPANMTLYAVWISNTTEYLVAFNANRGTGTMDSISGYIGTDVVLPDCTFTRDGYTFIGWTWNYAEEESEMVVDLAVGNAVTVEYNGGTIYAVWISNTTETSIIFDANGGTGTMDTIITDIVTEVTLPANTFTRDGYVFDKWCYDFNPPEKYIADQSTIMVPYNGLRLFAIWILA